MSKPEWGVKRICPSCGIKYYDFGKSPIICPQCNFEFDPDFLLKSRKGRGINNKVEENNKNNLEEDKIPLTNEEELENNSDIEKVIDIDDDNEIESSIEKEIEENLDETIVQNTEENEDDVPFIEEDLDEGDVSIEIDEEEDKNWF